jgi:FkbM family methyltransferase
MLCAPGTAQSWPVPRGTMANRRYNVLTSTDYGTMIVNRFDAAVSFNLSINGSWDRVAVGVLQELVRGLAASRKGNLVAVDVGANLGALAVPLGRALESRGVVHAFEPQRLIYYMLCGNVAISSLENVYCHRMAVSDQPGQCSLPSYRLDKIVNIGAYQLEKTEDTDFNGVVTSTVETAEIVTLDSFGLDRLDLLKVDVEGMEFKVLEGARQLIDAHKPAVLFEALKGEQDPLKQFFWTRGYRLFDYAHNTVAMPPDGIEIRAAVKEILPR